MILKLICTKLNLYFSYFVVPLIFLSFQCINIILLFVTECQDEIKLPSRILVELVPRCNDSWARVQSTAQNPCVQISVPLQYRLINLIQYFQKKWLPRHSKYVSFYMLKKKLCIHRIHGIFFLFVKNRKIKF